MSQKITDDPHADAMEKQRKSLLEQRLKLVEQIKQEKDNNVAADILLDAMVKYAKASKMGMFNW
ncbi:MAG: hypothetical protein WC979_01285 [Candidatus Pacearchaeota archaeon]|jgi:hypothetical protein